MRWSRPRPATASVASTRSDDGEGAALRLRDLSVTLDDGTAVVDDTDVAIMPGERVLIAGESGTGKSTLVRAIAGLWPWGDGRIEVQKGAKLLLLPQRPYVPIGTLRRAATYPDAADSRSVEDVAEAFRHVGLGASRSIASTRRRPGTRRCRAARSSGWRSPAFSCTTPTSSCSTRRPPRSIRRARTS